MVSNDRRRPGRRDGGAARPTRRWACAAAAAVAVACACGGSNVPPTTPSSTGTAGSGDPCAARARTGPAGPVTDPSGPYYHQVAIARSIDGVHLSDFQQVLDHASVPDAVRMGDGTVFIYYVNGAEGGIWAARLEGGAAMPVGPVMIDGLSGPEGIVDPDAMLLPDGRVRLTYLSGFGPPGSGSARAMCMADSTDGLRFTVAGTALPLAATDTITDPSVARLGDGSWLMAVSRGTQTLMARASDGLRFSVFATLTYGGVPEIAAMGGSGVRLYVCANGIESYVSADAGASWTREATVVPSGTLGRRIVCDPSWVPGADLFVFKTAS